MQRHGIGGRGLQTLCAVAVVLLSACAPRPGGETLTVVPEAEAAHSLAITVASTRGRDPQTGNYTDARARALNYERFTIAIPPDHEASKIEWPNEKPDPSRSFAVTARDPLPGLDIHRSGRGRQDVVVFVHGYNQTFPESLFRLAQVTADGHLPEQPILFAWPSAGTVVGYVADKDAALYSRDELAAMLGTLAADPDVGEITLFGHSMGGWLVVEALRQLRLSGQDRVIARLSDVVLAAPDIDVDVFRKQVEVIGPLDPPMAILVAPDDRALRISAGLAGARPRIGRTNASTPAVQALAKRYGVLLVDISAIGAVDGTHHNRFASLVQLMPERRDGLAQARAQVGAFILDPVSATLVALSR